VENWRLLRDSVGLLSRRNGNEILLCGFRMEHCRLNSMTRLAYCMCCRFQHSSRAFQNNVKRKLHL